MYVQVTDQIVIKIKGFEHLVESLLLDFLLRLSPNLGLVDAPILHLITLQNLAYHYPNHNFPKLQQLHDYVVLKFVELSQLQHPVQ